MVDLKSLESVALELARLLAGVGLGFFEGGVESERKRDRTLVSAADREVERVAREFLAKATPSLGFLGEETGKVRLLASDVSFQTNSTRLASSSMTSLVTSDSALLPHELGLNSPVADPLVLNEDTYWMLDPIDGTINFLAKSPLWSTLIALVHKGTPVLGLVVLPALDEVFLASRGNGARHGRLSEGLVAFRPCRVRNTVRLADAHISCSSPRTFTHRGIDGFFLDLCSASQELRTHSDAYGYTRVLNGGIDAMLDPLVAPYDVAALQVLFDETPGAVFTTLHGHQGPSRHRFGTGLGACSRALAENIVERYQAWACNQAVRLPKGGPEALDSFVETHALASERIPFSFLEGPGTATAAWTLALEKGVALFRKEQPHAHVEDVSVLVAWEESVSASVKNGVLSTAPKLECTLGVHVRSVVEGGCGLRVASLPLEGVPPETLVLDALRDAWQAAKPAHSSSTPGTEILAWREPLLGHFGPDVWGASLDFEAFQSVLNFVSEFQSDTAAEIQTVSLNVECALHKRLQVFFDGAQQTLCGVRFKVGGSVTARRGDEKRAAHMRFFENGIPPLESFKKAFVAELNTTKERARALLEAPLVPEDVSYSHLAVDADLLGLILHEALGHAAEGDLVELGSSGFGRPQVKNSEVNDSQDNDPRYVMQDIRVAPPWINIVIDGSLDNCGLLPIDCEGTPPLRKTIVREGMLVDGLHTRQTARSARRAPDGCARQESIFHPSLNRMTSIWVQAQGLRPLPLLSPSERMDHPSPESVQAVLEADGFLTPGKTVLYLSGWKGGTATCSNLEFRADVAFIHELQKGKPPRLLREANFTGIATDCFLSAVAAYGPVLCRTIGTCGKDSQGVPTSDGGPAILVLEKTPRVTVIGSGDSEE